MSHLSDVSRNPEQDSDLGVSFELECTAWSKEVPAPPW